MRTLSFEVIVDDRFDDKDALREILAQKLSAYEEAFRALGVIYKFHPFEDITFPPEEPYFKVGDYNNVFIPENEDDQEKVRQQIRDATHIEPILVVPEESHQKRCLVYVQKQKRLPSWNDVMHEINKIEGHAYQFVQAADVRQEMSR